MILHSYKELTVWQKSMDLVLGIYRLTSRFPREEIYVLTSQMRRSVISIPSNIAEGRRRSGCAEYRRFLTVAYASGAELETQIEISRRLGYANDVDFTKNILLLEEVMKMLNKMIMQLSQPS